MLKLVPWLNLTNDVPAVGKREDLGKHMFSKEKKIIIVPDESNFWGNFKYEFKKKRICAVAGT
ncbi:hypothetical protein DSO57_1020702 [Entomophthora muscae]|uniref:Uncharacterized protein n=1 Tax=Entomophthora muscae TaxID=34485 RepID=A0ACC2SSQ6_9FUNG|nr:hypothetical protein DSO57_1020702 [Entomophthora muscae]